MYVVNIISYDSLVEYYDELIESSAPLRYLRDKTLYDISRNLALHNNKVKMAWVNIKSRDFENVKPL